MFNTSWVSCFFLLPSVSYGTEHSGASLILVDKEFLPLTQGTKIPVIVSHDTGRPDDPYEEFLAKGRQFSKERGWLGLEPEVDENAPAVLCYTYAISFFGLISFHPSSGTTGRVIFYKCLADLLSLTFIQPKGVLTTLRGS